MKNPWIFGTITFLGGWLLQVVSWRFPWPASVSPHFLLLTVLALGSMGHTVMAQTLGFFWGLCLDVFGLSLFGTQAWLLALAGFITGRFSRQLNGEKLATQEILALAGIVFFEAGSALLDLFFRPSHAARPFFPGRMALVLAMNALFAPVIFRVLRRWMVLRGERISHD